MAANYEQHLAKTHALLNRGHQVGDIITVPDSKKPAIVRTCHHTGRRHVVVCYDSIIRAGIDPRFILIDFSMYRGPALKGYLKNQEHEGEIHSIRVTHVNPRSIYCEVVD